MYLISLNLLDHTTVGKPIDTSEGFLVVGFGNTSLVWTTQILGDYDCIAVPELGLILDYLKSL